jgi:hypothetical protein
LRTAALAAVPSRFCSAAHLQQLAAAGQQRLERAGRGVGQRLRLRADALGEQRQGGGDPVGLGQQAEGLGEVAGLAGVDDGDRQAGGGQRRGGGVLVAAGGLQDHQRRPQGRQPGDAVGQALRVVSRGEGIAAGADVDVAGGLGDVDADERGAAHGCALRRGSGAPAPPNLAHAVWIRATVRALAGKGARRPALPHGLGGQGVNGLPRRTIWPCHRDTP